jgi:hypothetical protein
MSFQTDGKDVLFHKHTILNVKLILPIFKPHILNTQTQIYPYYISHYNIDCYVTINIKLVMFTHILCNTLFDAHFHKI